MARCVAEGNELYPNATPIEFKTTLEGEVICPVAGRADDFGFQLEHPGLVFNDSPTLSCQGWQRPFCQSCVDACEPNNNINEPEAIALNQLMAPVSACNRDFDFFAVQLTADRDCRVVFNIRMGLGALDLLVTDGREVPALTLVQNGLQWTYTGRVARNARSFVRVYMDPGEAFDDLRVTQ